MVETLSIVLFLTATVLLIIISLIVGVFLRSLDTNSSACNIPEQAWPKVAVVLCLRGADPFLPDCLRALLQQNYPDYSLHIVVDSPEDPAWTVVKSFLETAPAVPIQADFLHHYSTTGSLKGSALVQAISKLDSTYDVVAFVDADVVTFPDWLRTLVAPLMDETVGVTTGNRWYIPQKQQWGSLVRHLWNTPAVVLMYLLGAVWGGTMALRLSTIHRSGLLQKWQQGISTDAPVPALLRPLGLKVKPISSLLMVNREDCSIAKSLRFIARQSLVGRLYFPKWVIVVFNAIAISAFWLCGLALLLLSLYVEDAPAILWSSGALCLYLLGMISFLLIIEHRVEALLQERHIQHETSSTYHPAPLLTPNKILRLVLAIPLTQGVYTLAMILASTMHQVEWRGITYIIKGPWTIQLQHYKPYCPAQPSVTTNFSL